MLTHSYGCWQNHVDAACGVLLMLLLRVVTSDRCRSLLSWLLVVLLINLATTHVKEWYRTLTVPVPSLLYDEESWLRYVHAARC